MNVTLQKIISLDLLTCSCSFLNELASACMPKAGYTLPAWHERGVFVACQLRGGCVDFSMSLHTRTVSDAMLLLLALSGHMYVSH